MTELPREFEDWTLAESNAFPSFYEGLGQISFGPDDDKREWRMGIAVGGHTLYLFTDIPHPDDTENRGRKCMYVMGVTKPFRRLADTLMDVISEEGETVG